jgi:hypothetical protein
MTQRRTLEQQRLDAAVWAAQLRRGLSVKQLAAAEGIETKQVYRDLRADGYSLSALQGKRAPEAAIEEEAMFEGFPQVASERPAWMHLSANDIAFLHRVREEIRAADRVMAYKSRARGQFMD